MQPISQAVARYLPISRQVHLELPGHGRRPWDADTTLTIEGLARDVLEQLKFKNVEHELENSILVGESTGALVLAAAAALIDARPLAGLFGEPPLSNGYGMRQVRLSLERQNTDISSAMQNVFGWSTNENRDFSYLFTDPKYLSLIIHGLQRTSNNAVPVHSVIEQHEIDAIPSHRNLLTCAMEGCGHRVLQNKRQYWALMLKSVLMAYYSGEWRRTKIPYS